MMVFVLVAQARSTTRLLALPRVNLTQLITEMMCTRFF